MARPGPAALIDERHFVPATIDQARQLYSVLVASGVSVAKARGIVTWLLVLPDRRADDPTSDLVRSEYRRALLNLGSPPWEASEATVGELRSDELSPRRRRGGAGRRPAGRPGRWRTLLQAA